MAQAAHPGVIAPPPLLYAGGFLLALALHSAWPFSLPSHPLTRGLGLAFVASGIALNLWGAYGLLKAKTPINPYRSVQTIVLSGAYGLSRNPLYVGLDLVFVGLFLIMHTAWGLVVLVPVLITMHYGVILREERYLEALFGEPYRRYCANVRRYL